MVAVVATALLLRHGSSKARQRVVLWQQPLGAVLWLEEQGAKLKQQQQQGVVLW